MLKFVAGILLCWLQLPGFGADVSRPLTVKADAAQIKSVGGITDGAWNLWSPGEWGDFFNFAGPGTYTVRVRAYGSPAGGVWPEMAFNIDGRTRETVAVSRKQAADYVFKFESTAGIHRLVLMFLNDAVIKTEDRNLYLVSLSLEASGKMPSPVLASETAWRASWALEQAQRENEILAQAAATIEKYRKSEAVVRILDENGRPMTDASLSVEQLNHDFLFGCNIYMFDHFGTPQENELYKERFRNLFNYATIGFYWKAYETEQGKPNYAYTDKVVAWCGQNQIRMKGHPLLWACEHGIPPWSKEQPAAAVQKQRVNDIMTRYAGKIDFWEVVNEPAHLPGLEIAEPYRWARNVNPQASLIVNDYSILADGYPPFFSLLQQNLAKQVPIDGIGIQAHEPRTMRFPLSQVREILDHYATLGKPLHITEFTPTSDGQEITGSHLSGKWDEAAQADYAVRFYTVCFAHPAVAGITWWDLCDAGAWLPGGGLIRRDLSPKPAYLALQKLIREQWLTRQSGHTDRNGQFVFRGFHGQYRLRIVRNGKTLEKPFRVGPATPNVIEASWRESAIVPETANKSN